MIAEEEGTHLFPFNKILNVPFLFLRFFFTDMSSRIKKIMELASLEKCNLIEGSSFIENITESTTDMSVAAVATEENDIDEAAMNSDVNFSFTDIDTMLSPHDLADLDIDLLDDRGVVEMTLVQPQIEHATIDEKISATSDITSTINEQSSIIESQSLDIPRILTSKSQVTETNILKETSVAIENIPGPSFLNKGKRRFSTYPSFHSNTDDSDPDFEIESQENFPSSDTSADKTEEQYSSDSTGNIEEEKDLEKKKAFGLRKAKKVNKRLVQKEKRNMGKTYTNYKGIEKGERRVKPNPCLNGKCPNKCKLFDKMTRLNLFKQYWELPYQSKRDFIASNISVRDIKRRRVGNAESRKDLSRDYFLPFLNEKLKVCRKFFMSTLDVTDKLLRYTEIYKSEISVSKADRRGKSAQEQNCL